MSSPVVVLTWQVQGTTGWGLFGLHLGLALTRRGVRVGVGDLVQINTIPAVLRASTEAWARREGDEGRDVVMLQGLSNNFEAPAGVNTTAAVRAVGLAIFEDPVVDGEAVERLKAFDQVIVPSQWCQGVLERVGVASQVIHQGFDGAVWRPAFRRRTDDRFLVFSGGKLEFRKGQDILVEAFKRFLQTPEGKDAVLVTQWHNQWPQTMEGIWSKGWVRGIPNQTIYGTDVAGWTQANGVPEGRHLDLGMTSNAESAAAIRECDVAVFPSRAEGATNMVLCETMATGVPCIVARNTGQADVPDAVYWLDQQTAVTGPCRLFRGFDGWGESDPDEIVERLKEVRNHPVKAKVLGMTATRAMHRWTWEATADQWIDALKVRP